MRQWQRWGVKLPGQNYPGDSNIPKGVGLNGMVKLNKGLFHPTNDVPDFSTTLGSKLLKSRHLVVV